MCALLQSGARLRFVPRLQEAYALDAFTCSVQVCINGSIIDATHLSLFTVHTRSISMCIWS